MKAFIISVISKSRKYADIRNSYVRIYDFSPSAKVRLLDYKTDSVVDALKKSTIQLEGISVERQGLESQFRLYYYGVPIEKVVPVLNNRESISRKLIALDINANDGEPKIILTDCRGNIVKAKLDDVIYKYRDRICNIGLTLKKPNNNIPSLSFDNKEYIITDAAGRSLYKSTVKDNFDYEQILRNEWLDIKEFEQIAQSNGIEYKINESSMIGYDRRLKVWNIPYGIKNMLSFYDQDSDNQHPTNIDIDLLKISSTCDFIGDGAFKDVNSIRRVLWQPRRHTSLNSLSAFNKLLERGGLSRNYTDWLPETINDIHGFLSYRIDPNKNKIKLKFLLADTMQEGGTIRESFKSIDFESKIQFNNEIKSVIDSFNFCSNEQVDVSNIKSSIRDSFNKSNCMITSKFNNNILEISDSFEEIQNTRIDLSNCRELKSITNSFNYCPYLEEVILPGSVQVQSSFNNCPKLKVLVLEPDKNYTLYGSFLQSAINDFEINSKINIAGSFNSSTSFKVSISEISSITYNNYSNNKELILNDGITELADGTFRRCNLGKCELKLPNGIRSIGKEAFAYSNINKLDLYNLECNKLGDRTFIQAIINTLILPKNTVKLGSMSLNHAVITGLFIPSTLQEINAQDIKGITGPNNGLVTVYTGNKNIEKILGKQFKQIQIRKFDTDEEAYLAISGSDNKADGSIIARVRLLMGNSDNEIDNEISSDKYIENALELRSIYQGITGTEIYDEDFKLDRSKYTDICCADELEQILLEWDMYAKGSIATKCAEGERIGPTFAALSNFITSSIKPLLNVGNCEDFKNIIDKITEEALDRQHFTVYKRYMDDSCSISNVVINITQTNGLSYLDGTRVVFTIISVRNRVVFIGSEHASVSEACSVQMWKNIASKILDDGPDYAEKMKCSMYKALKPGDRINLKISLIHRGPTEVSPKLARLTRDRFLDTILNVGVQDVDAQYTIAVLMSIPDGGFYKVKVTKDSDVKIYDINRKLQATYKEVYIIDKYKDFASLDEESKKIIDDTVGKSASKLIRRLLNYTSLLEIKKKAENAYDDLEPSYDWVIAEALQTLKVSKVEDLSSYMVEKIFETGYFTKVLRKIDEPRYTRMEFKTTDNFTVKSYSYETSKRVISGMYDLVATTISAIVDKDKKITYYVSSDSFDKVLNQILSLYDKSKEPIWEVSNKAYSLSDFHNLDYKGYFGTTSNRVTATLRMSKGSGAIFLVASKNNEAITLYRIKNTGSAKKMIKKLYSTANADGLDNILNNLRNYGEELIGGFDVQENYYTKLRSVIMDGIPNGIDISTRFKEFEELIARQHK